MSRRTPVFSGQHIDHFRTQLAMALGESDYWQKLPQLRLIAILATVYNPEFANSTHGDEAAAIAKLIHDAPSTVKPPSVSRIAKLLLEKVFEQQAGESIQTVEGFETLLNTMDEIVIPNKRSQLEPHIPLVVVVRGLSGSGKSRLAETMSRVGFKNHPDVARLSSDIYLSRAGTDPKSKRAAYRTESGDVKVADPIHSRDPISEVKQLLWCEEFRQELEQLAQRHRVIVVDGGYGDLLLEQIGIPPTQRFAVEVYAAPGTRFAWVKERAERALPADRAAVRVMNDMLVAMAWFSHLMEHAALPDIVVVDNHAAPLEEAIAARSAQLGREARAADSTEMLLRQFNIAREPRKNRATKAELEQLLDGVFHDGSVQAAASTKPLPEIYRQLPQDLKTRLNVSQLQLLLAHRREVS